MNHFSSQRPVETPATRRRRREQLQSSIATLESSLLQCRQCRRIETTDLHNLLVNSNLNTLDDDVDDNNDTSSSSSKPICRSCYECAGSTTATMIPVDQLLNPSSGRPALPGDVEKTRRRRDPVRMWKILNALLERYKDNHEEEEESNENEQPHVVKKDNRLQPFPEAAAAPLPLLSGSDAEPALKHLRLPGGFLASSYRKEEESPPFEGQLTTDVQPPVPADPADAQEDMKAKAALSTKETQASSPMPPTETREPPPPAARSSHQHQMNHHHPQEEQDEAHSNSTPPLNGNHFNHYSHGTISQLTGPSQLDDDSNSANQQSFSVPQSQVQRAMEEETSTAAGNQAARSRSRRPTSEASALPSLSQASSISGRDHDSQLKNSNLLLSQLTSSSSNHDYQHQHQHDHQYGSSETQQFSLSQTSREDGCSSSSFPNDHHRHSIDTACLPNTEDFVQPMLQFYNQGTNNENALLHRAPAAATPGAPHSSAVLDHRDTTPKVDDKHNVPASTSSSPTLRFQQPGEKKKRTTPSTTATTVTAKRNRRLVTPPAVRSKRIIIESSSLVLQKNHDGGSNSSSSNNNNKPIVIAHDLSNQDHIETLCMLHQDGVCTLAAQQMMMMMMMMMMMSTADRHKKIDAWTCTEQSNKHANVYLIVDTEQVNEPFSGDGDGGGGGATIHICRRTVPYLQARALGWSILSSQCLEETNDGSFHLSPEALSNHLVWGDEILYRTAVQEGRIYPSLQGAKAASPVRSSMERVQRGNEEPLFANFSLVIINDGKETMNDNDGTTTTLSSRLVRTTYYVHTNLSRHRQQSTDVLVSYLSHPSASGTSV